MTTCVNPAVPPVARALALLASAVLCASVSAAEPTPSAANLTGIAIHLQPSNPTYTAIAPGGTHPVALPAPTSPPASAADGASRSSRVLAATE
ncbi:MAG: hypothetical protein H6983_04725 [Ectothiorhodospiraceae bacterium]|nr:hypothetical protein [Ectothiorhodospiraceae bacterium]